MADDTRRLTRCLTFIKENTSQVEKLLDILIEDEIIGLDERSQILTKLPLENQIHALIETVIRKQAHQSFLEALKKSGNSHVVDKITGCTFQKEEKNINRENTYTIQLTDEDENVEKSEKDQYSKEKSLEELKIENDRLKTQQSFVRDQLNEKHKKIQKLKLEIVSYKRQNTDLNDQLKAFDGLQVRLQDIDVELIEKEKSNNIIEMALSERSKEIYVLQMECEDLKIENEQKSEQIADLNIQMKVLKTALKKASKDRQRLEEKIEDMSNNMNDKFSDMMNALDDLKGIYNRPAQCEVTTPRNASSFRPQLARKVPLMVPKQKAYITQLSRIKR